MGGAARRGPLAARLKRDADYLRRAEKANWYGSVADAVADVYRRFFKIGEPGYVIFLFGAGHRRSKEWQSDLSPVSVTAEHQIYMLDEVAVKRNRQVWVVREEQFEHGPLSAYPRSDAFGGIKESKIQRAKEVRLSAVEIVDPSKNYL